MDIAKKFLYDNDNNTYIHLSDAYKQIIRDIIHQSIRCFDEEHFEKVRASLRATLLEADMLIKSDHKTFEEIAYVLSLSYHELKSALGIKSLQEELAEYEKEERRTNLKLVK
jgi:hypothetical protein